MDEDEDEEAFRQFVLAVEPRLRRALVAAYGVERGREATAEALGWAWEHRDRLGDIKNPVAYLYRVGQSRSRRRRRRVLYERSALTERAVEPGLDQALASLPERQRVAAFLIYGNDWTPSEVAELLGIDVSTVNTHLARALARLRAAIQGGSDEHT